MRTRRLELPQPNGHQPLKLARLPIPPRAQELIFMILKRAGLNLSVLEKLKIPTINVLRCKYKKSNIFIAFFLIYFFKSGNYSPFAGIVLVYLVPKEIQDNLVSLFMTLKKTGIANFDRRTNKLQNGRVYKNLRAPIIKNIKISLYG